MSSDWRHRDHPTVTALTGFFAGVALTILVPAVVIAVLPGRFGGTGGTLAAVGLLLVPVGLAAVARTRRFGLYMAFGMLVTVLVVAGVTAGVLWFLVRYGG